MQRHLLLVGALMLATTIMTGCESGDTADQGRWFEKPPSMRNAEDRKQQQAWEKKQKKLNEQVFKPTVRYENLAPPRPGSPTGPVASPSPVVPGSVPPPPAASTPAPPPPKATGGGANQYLVSYAIVLLGVGLGLLLVCNSSRRRDRAAPEKYGE